MVDTSGKHRSIACEHALPRVSRDAHGPPLTRIKRALGQRAADAAPPHAPHVPLSIPLAKNSQIEHNFISILMIRGCSPLAGRPCVRGAARPPASTGEQNLDERSDDGSQRTRAHHAMRRRARAGVHRRGHARRHARR
ncbi:hypothetical protein, partial [Burkholderia thailandensis]|uniref:hypothetical protein n=1 Tax=Burkholderia thailandensis TaxID=57975 RepID=UPI001E499860